MKSLVTFQESLIFVEIFAAVTGLFSWRKSSNIWRFFAVYLCTILVIEIIARGLPREYKNPFYSWTMPVHFLSFFYIFLDRLFNFNRFILLGITIYIVAFFIEVVFNWQIIASFFSFSYTIGNIILLIFTLFYFYDLALSDRILNFHNEQMFWLACGIIIYYLGSLPFFGLFNYLKTNNIEIMLTYRWGVIVLDYLMYLCFAISFLWPKKN